MGDIIEKYEDPVETPHNGYERLGIRSHAKGTFHSYVEPGKELGTARMHRVAANKFIVNITFGWEHAVAITNDSDAGKLVSHRFPQFSFNKKMIPKFFKYVMVDKKFREHLELSSPGGAGRNRVLKINDMLDYDVKYPNVEEQIKIMKYLSNLDNLITFHQRKLIILSDYFKAWEQRKLGDAVDICSGRDYKHLDAGDVPVYGTGGYMLSISESLSEDQDAIGIGRKGTIDKPFILKAPFWTVDTLFYCIPKDNYDLCFVFDVFQNISWKEMDESTGVPSLSKALISKVDVLVPKGYDEQIKIGEYFNQLDNLITFHRRAHK